MKYYSTGGLSPRVDLRSAILKSLPSDNGLYLPDQILPMGDQFFKKLPDLTLLEIAYEVINNLIAGEIPSKDLKSIVQKTFDFPVVLNEIGNIHVAELWHGPTLAFKDFGARFMSRLFAYFLKNDDQKLTILTATSGDTGGAVAAGFFETPNVEVIILYPKGKVSDFQERQITTWGKNITAISIDGTFDDCQRLVKLAFLDPDIAQSKNLSSANSINLARLIPQSVYYFESLKKLLNRSEPTVVSVPSGNFGNLTAGILAQKMGLPISRFIAATNSNNIVPTYLTTGHYQSQTSVSTISNAMDVGNPSNFSRLLALHNKNWSKMTKNISGDHFTDHETLEIIENVYRSYDYILDPHSAIAYGAMKSYLVNHKDHIGISISTAHPVKFESALSSIPNLTIDIPVSVEQFYQREKKFDSLSKNYQNFKKYLL